MKILFIEHNFDIETPIRLIKSGHQVDIVKEEIENIHEFDRTSLLETLKSSQPDILVCGFKFQIDREVLDLAPIKAIFTRTTGKDHIDLKYCEEKGIEVVNLQSGWLTEVVAVPELCLWAMLELVRRRGGRELKGKTLGIIGYGRIGQLLDRMIDGFCVDILRYDNDPKDFGLDDLDNLDDLLKKSDIVSLNISSTEENRNFFDKDKFAQMKEGSYFLNSSRNWLVDNDAFKWALDNKLAGAWSDFEVPFEHPKLLVTNHKGGKTLESSLKTEKILVDKIIAWCK